MAFDTTRLIAQMNIVGSLPDGRFEAQELLDIAYDSLLSEFVPEILAVREEFYVTSKDYTVAADQAAYLIPSRAINGVLREVKLVRNGQVIDLERIDLEDITSTATGNPSKFYMSGSSVHLYPTPATGGDTLRLYYFMRPSKLVSVSECARITAIDGDSCSITIPTGWTTSNTFDLLRGRSPFDILDFDLVATDVSAGTITFSSAVPSTLAVGDYVALAEESCFVQMPTEGFKALVQSATTSALESIGDPFSQTSAAKAAVLKSAFVNSLKVRVQGAPKTLSRRLL